MNKNMILSKQGVALRQLRRLHDISCKCFKYLVSEIECDTIHFLGSHALMESVRSNKKPLHDNDGVASDKCCDAKLMGCGTLMLGPVNLQHFTDREACRIVNGFL